MRLKLVGSSHTHRARFRSGLDRDINRLWLAPLLDSFVSRPKLSSAWASSQAKKLVSWCVAYFGQSCRLKPVEECTVSIAHKHPIGFPSGYTMGSHPRASTNRRHKPLTLSFVHFLSSPPPSRQHSAKSTLTQALDWSLPVDTHRLVRFIKKSSRMIEWVLQVLNISVATVTKQCREGTPRPGHRSTHHKSSITHQHYSHGCKEEQGVTRIESTFHVQK